MPIWSAAFTAAGFTEATIAIGVFTNNRSTFDAAERKQLMFEYNQIFTENVYNLGVFF